MKYILLTITILFSQFQTEKHVRLDLTVQETEQVLNIIDNSAVVGEIRKPLYNKIYSQATAQLKDTTKKK